MYTDFGSANRWESDREPGDTRWATSIVGNPDTIWTDGSNDTYATIQYGGYEDPWGHVYAQMLELPLEPDAAVLVEEVIVTWTARLVEEDPDSEPGYGSSVSPIIRLGAYEPDNAGPNWHSLGTAAYWGANRDSLYYDVNPQAPYEELYLPRDGSWKTFRERLSPIYTDRNLTQLLSHDFSGSTYPTQATMEGYGVVDPYHHYLIIYQESFWSEEKFAVSEISLEFVGLDADTVIRSGGTMARARFT
jgi:hypothetical protein